MLISIRPELHERYPYDTIPATDYAIEAEEFAKVGAFKMWKDTTGANKKLPPAFYIAENLSRETCRKTISEIERRTGRRLSATMHSGEEIFFFNLSDAPPTAASSFAQEVSSMYSSLFGSAPSTTSTSSDDSWARIAESLYGKK